MNMINSITVNGITVDPYDFTVKCETRAEFDRANIAAGEFLGFCDVSYDYTKPELTDEDGNLGVCYFVGDHPERTSGIYRVDNEDKLVCFICNHSVAFDFANGTCRVTLDEKDAKNGYTYGGYFASQEGTALGRFLGQGLEIIPNVEKDDAPLTEVCQINIFWTNPKDHNGKCGYLAD